MKSIHLSLLARSETMWSGGSDLCFRIIKSKILNVFVLDFFLTFSKTMLPMVSADRVVLACDFSPRSYILLSVQTWLVGSGFADAGSIAVVCCANSAWLAVLLHTCNPARQQKVWMAEQRAGCLRDSSAAVGSSHVVTWALGFSLHRSVWMAAWTSSWLKPVQ